MSSAFLRCVSYEDKYFSAFLFPEVGGWGGRGVGQKSLLLLQQPQTTLQ